MTIEVSPGDVVMVNGLERFTVTTPGRLKGDAKPKKPREGGAAVLTLECPEGCARGEDGRPFHVSMGKARFAQWGAPLCGFCKTRMVPREN